MTLTFQASRFKMAEIVLLVQKLSSVNYLFFLFCLLKQTNVDYGQLNVDFSHLPSSVWGPFCSTTVTLAGSAKVTKPNPLDRPDSAFFMTTQSITSPYREKYLCRLSWEVSHESPPTNSFLEESAHKSNDFAQTYGEWNDAARKRVFSRKFQIVLRLPFFDRSHRLGSVNDG